MTRPERGLIGDTGFVGGTLLRARSFDRTYNSRTIDDSAGRSFGMLVCAGAPSLKWHANAYPDLDEARIGRLMRSLEQVHADAFVLISTVSVYARPAAVDEDSDCEAAALQPYGRHRLALEHFVRERFADTTIVRLPGVFGPGLKKNVVFDLLRGDYRHVTAPDSLLQFYDVTQLADDIDRARAHHIRLLNVATEPVTLRAIAHACGADRLDEQPHGAVAHEDMRSRYAPLWGHSDHYLYSSHRVLEALTAFAATTTAASS